MSSTTTADYLEVYRQNGGPERIDSLTKAFRALKDCGCAHNTAYLIDSNFVHGPKTDFSILVYNALLFNGSTDQTIGRPSEAYALSDFLHRMFGPFLYTDAWSRPLIDAHRMNEEEKKRIPGYGVKLKTDIPVEAEISDILHLSMLLHIPKELHEEAFIELNRQSDSSETEDVDTFVLD